MENNSKKVLKEVLHQLKTKVNPEVNSLGELNAQRAVLQVVSSKIHGEKLFNALGRYDNVKKDGSNEHDESTLELRDELLDIAASLVELCIIFDKDLLSKA